MENQNQPQDQNKTSMIEKAKGAVQDLADKISHVFISEKEPKAVPNEWEQEEKDKEAKEAELKKQQEGGQETQPERKKSLTEKINDVISQGYQSVKGHFSQDTQNKIEEKLHVNKEEKADTEFHEVTTGFSETVQELKHEQRVEALGQEELVSSNPFDSLATGEKESENKEAPSGISSRIAETKDQIASKFTQENKESTADA